ncbi:DNA damage-regulated autophagy modulator protein 1-like [Centruroides vittatus]|uniref:DNA damage-regulated autophagy modulator protein 1-like n=1 Tax=Centruroides vittatus TaxID=120091 RepID=UPI00350EDB90
MTIKRLHLLPALVAIILLATFIITYIIAVILDHARPFWPYISDTGTTHPESMIFGQFLNLGSVFIFLTMYVRYLLVNKKYLHDPNFPNYKNVKLFNKISLWFALYTSVGASLVANFQETVAIIPHMIGASSCYIGGTTYFTLQAIISYMTCPHINTLQMARFRLFLAILSGFLTAICGLFGIISYFMFTKSVKDIPKWAPGEGGFEIHIVSSLSEWAVTVLFAIYFITFVKDFKNVIVTCPKLEFVNQLPNRSYNPCTISTVDRTTKKVEEDNNKNIALTENISLTNLVQSV